MTSLSQNKFARACNVSQALISKLAKQGKLPCNPDRSIPVADGIKAMQLINPEHTFDEERLRVHQQEKRKKEKRKIAVSSRVTRVSLDIKRSELEERGIRGQLLQLELEKRRGALIPIEEAQAEGAAVGRVLRAALRALPPRVALIIEGLCAGDEAVRAAKIQAVIEDEVELMLASLNRFRFVRTE